MNFLANHFWQVFGEVSKWVGIGLIAIGILGVIFIVVVMRDIDRDGWH